MSIHPRHRRLFQVGSACIVSLSVLGAVYGAGVLFPPAYSDFAGVLRACAVPLLFMAIWGVLQALFALILGLLSWRQ